MEKEKWVPIKGYEGIYAISNLGRVRSLDRAFVDIIGRNYIKIGKVMKQTLCKQTGYWRIGLTNKDGVQKDHNVHRLLAEAFLPNPDNLPCVNHRDENRANNSICNLEWCSYQYNNTYGTATKRRSVSLKKYNEKNAVSVCQFSNDGSLINTHPSIKKACESLGVEDTGNIGLCINRKIKTAYGFVWRRLGESFEKPEPNKPKRHQKNVKKIDAQGNVVTTYKSVSEAAESNGFDRHLLSRDKKSNEHLVNGYLYVVETKGLSSYVPIGHKGPRHDLKGKGAKPVSQFTRDGVFVRDYNSATEAASSFGKKSGGDITNCCRGKLRSAYNYIWKYKEE